MRLFKQWAIARSPFHRRYRSPTIEVMAQVDKRIAVQRDPGFVYFRIPKAANSTVVATLHSYLQSGREATAEEAKRSFLRATDLEEQEVGGLPLTYFLFTFVRDPFARLASAYLDKVVNARDKMLGKKAVVGHLDRPLDASVSFIEFCRFLEEGGLYSNAHWYPQVTFIPCGAEMLDFVGRVESLREDLQHLVAQIFPAVQPSIVDWAPHRTGADDRLTQLYCADSLSIVRRLYRADFETFGYSQYPAWAQALEG